MNMPTLDYLVDRFNLDLTQKSPIAIPNFGRDQLAAMLSELGFETGVEVGVAAGEYLEILCKANPDMVFYGVDPWVPQPGYRDYTRDSTFSRLYADTQARMKPYYNHGLIKGTSAEALGEFDDGELDFVYIDADHSFNHVVHDIHEWSKKLKPGGILAGHDYFKPKNQARIHVMQATQGYFGSWGLKPWFVLGNEATDESLIRDKPRSWMWIK